MRGVATSETSHVLALVRSLYPVVDVERVSRGYDPSTTDAEVEALQKEVDAAAEILAGDLILFPENGDAGEP